MRSLLSSAAAVASCAALLLTSAPLLVAEARPNWGVLGHYMTAAVAQGFLTRNATLGVVNLLPETNGDMSRVASWADEYGRSQFPWSPSLHFADTPDWACNYSRSRDCFDSGVPGFCVDGAIQNFTGQLLKGYAPLSLNVALKFLIHFVGDIHQPLHVGFITDQGGNTLMGTFEGTPGRKLHQVWDVDMIMKRINDDFQNSNTTYLQYYMNRLQSGDWASKVSGWRACPSSPDPTVLSACSQSWASEGIVLACSTAYVDQTGSKIANGFNLGDAYYKFAYPVVEMQIAKGGIRLANVLNDLFASPSMARYTLEREDFLASSSQQFEGEERRFEGIMEQDEDIVALL